jgi:hypothetical protein
MTDKEKIKAEVERMMAEEMQFYETACNEGNEEATGSPMAYTRLQMLLNFINSIPEEPARKVWHDTDEVPMKGADIAYYYPNKNRIESRKGGMSTYLKRHRCKWAYTADLAEIEEIPPKLPLVSQEQEPASKDLDEEINAYLKVSLAVKFPTLDIESIKADVRYIARHFAEWQKQQMMKDVKDATVIMTHVTMEAVVPALSVVLLDDTYHEGDKVKLTIVKED